MPDTSDRTALLDAAELLFARSGVYGASLREVTLAAGVRNKSAIQYHFGTRDGLVRAMLARRGETLRMRRALVLEQLVVDGLEADPRSMCRAVVDPYCKFLGDGVGALSYLVVVREVVGDPRYAYEELPTLFSDPVLPALIARLIAAVDAPADVGAERALVAVSSVIGSVADRARRQLHEASPRPVSPVPIFVGNLLDMLTAAVTAPVHPSTLAFSGPPAKATLR
jgi:AcrR family transcriptional regulator